MSFINCNEINFHYTDKLFEDVCFQTFRREIQEFKITVSSILKCLPDFVKFHSGIHCQCRNISCFEILYLVFYQCNQGTNDNAYPGITHGRSLETNGLSTAGWKDCKRIVTL